MVGASTLTRLAVIDEWVCKLSWSLRAALRCSPQPLRHGHWIAIEMLPPSAFTAAPVELTMVKPAKRHREFITDFAPKRALLRKPEMVCI